MHRPPAALLFDLDGVLVSSVAAWFGAVEAAGTAFRGRAVSREEFDPTFGQGTQADIGCFGFDCSVEELDAFYDRAFVNHLSAVSVDPWAHTVLARLCKANWKIALVTNTREPTATKILQHASLEKYFPIRESPSAQLLPKPAPDMLVDACRRLRVSPAQSWMIGDSRFDRESAANAGCSFVGMRFPGDSRIEELTELLQLVGLPDDA